jgi:hypothetical protein
MTEAHHARAHSQWSASATARNIQCPGAIAMSTLCEDVEREAAAWGTACHQLAEKVLRNLLPFAAVAIGTTEKSGKFEFVVDEEMANCAQVYVDYCRGRLDEYYYANNREPAQFWIEHPLSLDALDPPLEAGGTGDFVIWFPKWKLLEVVDLKGGRGVTVDVVGNPQGRSYAIGAVLSLPDVKPERVRVTIVQPRVGDGLPKSDEFFVTELFDWTHDLLDHMERATYALDEFQRIGGPDNSVRFDDWASKWLTPGQCTFCTAKPICPALRKKALAAMPDLARQWHEDTTLTTPPTLSNLARVGSVQELEHDLDGIETLKEWIGARAAYAKMLAEQGTKFENWYLADSVGHRKYVEKDQVKLAATLRKEFDLSPTEVLEPNVVKSPAQIEKLLKGDKKKKFAAAEKTLWVKPITGKNLVRGDRTTRSPALSTAERFNETVE